jgi:hypothetical protein
LTKKRDGATLLTPAKRRDKKLLEMAATDDDPIASWQDRVGTLRKRGRVGAAALTVVPADEIDVRLGRPPAPERLPDEERALWEKLTFSRRPGYHRVDCSARSNRCRAPPPLPALHGYERRRRISDHLARVF